ncbi:acid sugar phosphatase [Clostridia bacterium]|nr:acid sugar phosphatase [Clostridia bacterium]
MLREKSFLIFDMDGTIYLGESPLPGALGFFARLRDSGKRFIYFTNNASKDLSAYESKLERLGFPVFDGCLMSSAEVTARHILTQYAGKTVYVLGTLSLAATFAKAGINVTDGDADVVVTSFDTTLTYERLSHVCTLIRNGAVWLTTHPDVNCPTEHGFVPDSGAINAAISASTGKSLPKAFGKPSADALAVIEDTYGVKRADMAVFGDRLYTDIAFGRDNGMFAVLMLTGEATRAEAMNLPQQKQPEAIYENLAEAAQEIFAL